MKYEVVFQVAASQGGVERKVEVDVTSSGASAQDERALAITMASLKLDDEGIDRWSFLRCVPVTS